MGADPERRIGSSFPMFFARFAVTRNVKFVRVCKDFWEKMRGRRCNDDLLPLLDLISGKLKCFGGCTRHGWRNRVEAQRFHHRVMQRTSGAELRMFRDAVGEKLIGFLSALLENVGMAQQLI